MRELCLEYKCYGSKMQFIASWVIQKKSEIFICGCPCSLSHISASHTNNAFSETLKLNVENVCINLF